MVRSRAVLIFARTPEAEARAKHLRVSRTASLFEAVIALWLRAAERAGAAPIIACAAADRRRLATIASGVPREWIDQPSGSFGARLSSVATEAFGRGYRAIVVTGIDTPPPASLGDVFGSLESGAVDAVIVPARDGGVNLIGLTADATKLLASIRAGQCDVARRCQDFFGERMLLMRATGDLDRAADLIHALTDASWSPLHALIAGALEAVWHSRSVLAPADPHASPTASRAPPFAA